MSQASPLSERSPQGAAQPQTAQELYKKATDLEQKIAEHYNDVRAAELAQVSSAGIAVNSLLIDIDKHQFI